MMQQHIGRAGRIGLRVVADHRVEAVHRLHRIGFEPAIQIIGGRFGEQDRAAARSALDVELAVSRLPSNAALIRFAETARIQPCTRFGGALQHHITQHYRRLSFESSLEGVVAPRHPFSLNFAISRLCAAFAGERDSGRHRVGRKLERAPLDNLQAMGQAGRGRRITFGLSRLTV